MEFVFLRDSENCGVRYNQMKGGRMESGSLGSRTMKRLVDISNLPQEAEPLSQVENLKSPSLTTNQYIEQLRKENITLTKVLADRNKIIELSGAELHKLRINLQKLQVQNQQLAQANSQMLAELNLGKDKRRVLDHELGCKNGLLHAIKLELLVKYNNVEESSQANKGNNKRYAANKRRQSRKPSLDPSTSKPVERKRKVDNKRLSLRRSKRFIISEEPYPPEALPKEPEPTEVIPKQPELNFTSTTFEPHEALENKRPCLRRQSARLRSDESEPTEDMLQIDDGKPIEAEIKADHRRPSLRRQSMSFKPEESVAIEAMSEEAEPALDTSLTTDVKPPKAKQNKRHCSKRESVSGKSEECEPIDDLFEMEDTKFPVAPLFDNLEHTSPPISFEKEDEEKNGIGRDKSPELTRLSIGRPLRQAAVKIQSFKELPLNVKMRRTD